MTIKSKLTSRWLKKAKKARLQFSEGGKVEDPNKPYITIDDVKIYVEDLPEEAQGIFGRLQRLNQKKVNIQLDLEEVQAGINFFSDKIIALVNEEGQENIKPVSSDEELVVSPEN
tara:strand:+ start:2195 stop:2539 length:345 start_codon:yes stop_codon:yes gene_type:complete